METTVKYKIAKVLVLPSTLKPDTFYFIKNGSSFDIKITDGNGVIVSNNNVQKIGSTPQSIESTLTAPKYIADKFEGELFQQRVETTVNGIATPVTLASTAGSGTLPAGTYSHRISAFNEYGDTLASAETLFTLGATGGVINNWNPVTGATGYKIYGRTQGSELLIASVGLVTTYLDDGSITPSGALPLENTTGFFELDWSKSVHVVTLNVGATIANTNLPQGDDTKVIEMIVSGNQTLKLPAVAEGFPSNDPPIGTVRRHYVFSCINGNTGFEDILFQLTNLAT